MAVALERHDAVMRSVIEAHGYVFKTVGDAFCAAFAEPGIAVEVAANLQRALATETWPDGVTIKVRMALHSGQCVERDGDYFGQPVNRVARLEAIAHGGQVVLSGAAAALVRSRLPAGTSLRDMGEHRLKDLGSPEHVFQLDIDGLPSNFDPLKSLSNPALRHNLPTQLSSFVGRAAELSVTRDLVKSSRLVTLTGAGGSGKTRLSLQVAGEMLEGDGDGVWFANLAPLTHDDAVIGEITGALGISGALDRPLAEIFRPLRTRSLLLVIDNCEHVLDSVSRIVETLLLECPQVHVVATSRTPLRVSGEVVYRVPTMALPAVDADSSDAVMLFYERATNHRADFPADQATRDAVLSICRQLDGLPLAIELATARLGSMSVFDVERRLGDRFKLLTGGLRSALPRQQTLKAMIDWSYELLTAAEAMVFACLGKFRGGWTLEAAEEVVGAACPYIADVVDVHSSLVDKSLVQFTSGDEGSRFSTLDTIGEYARQRLTELDPATVARLRDGHLNCYLALAERAHPDRNRPHRARAVHALAVESENVFEALDCCIEAGDAERGLRLVMAFAWSRLRGDQRLTDKVTSLLAIPCTGLQSLQAKAHIECVFRLTYRSAEARRFHVAEAVRLAREGEEGWILAEALHNLAWMRFLDGDPGEAALLQDEALAVAESIGDPMMIMVCRRGRGWHALHAGRLDEARLLVGEVRAMAEMNRNPVVIADSLMALATIEFLDGNLDSVRDLLDQATHMTVDDGSGANLRDWSKCVLAMVATAEHDLVEAVSLLHDGLRGASIEGEVELVGHAIVGYGQVAAMLGEYQLAAEFIGLADRHYADAHVARPEQPFWSIRNSTHEAACAALTVDELDHWYRQGRSASPGTTIDAARRLVEDLTAKLHGRTAEVDAANYLGQSD
jgi:predicted ATPase